MVFAILFFVVFMGYELISLVGKSMDAAKARKTSESQVVELSKKQTELQSKIDALQTPDGREAVLREQYPVVSPGEHVVVITEETPTTTLAQSDTTNNTHGSFWAFLKNIFSKKSD